MTQDKQDLCECGHRWYEHYKDYGCVKCDCPAASEASRELPPSRPIPEDTGGTMEECPACEGTGNCAVHGLDPAPCSYCNGTGKIKHEQTYEALTAERDRLREGK